MVQTWNVSPDSSVLLPSFDDSVFSVTDYVPVDSRGSISQD